MENPFLETLAQAGRFAGGLPGNRLTLTGPGGEMEFSQPAAQPRPDLGLLGPTVTPECPLDEVARAVLGRPEWVGHLAETAYRDRIAPRAASVVDQFAVMPDGVSEAVHEDRLGHRVEMEARGPNDIETRAVGLPHSPNWVRSRWLNDESKWQDATRGTQDRRPARRTRERPQAHRLTGVQQRYDQRQHDDLDRRPRTHA
jgi:hypothetical protein